MQVRHTLLLIFLLSMSLYRGHSQHIQSGLSSIRGSVEVNHSTHTNYEYSQVALAPNYGQFITDHVFVGGQAQVFSNPVYAYGSSVYQSYAAYGQYYFNPNGKWVVFSTLSLNAGLRYPGSFSISDNKFDAQSLGLSVGIGVHRFLNQELALQGELTYSLGRITYPMKKLYESLYGGDGYPFALKLKIGINSFIDFGNTRSFEQSYVGKKRQIINATGGLTFEDLVTGQLNYGYFVFDNLLVGASLEGGADIAPSIYVEYLQPIHNKLFCHLKAKNSVYGGNSTAGFTYGLDVGLDYFLTPYTMIEANLFSYQHRYIHEEPNFSHYHPDLFSYGPQVGLRYFLR